MSRDPWLEDDDPRHGTIGGYTNHGCRCERCTEANRIQQARYQARRREEELLFDPDAVAMTLHVLERYLQRRNATHDELKDAEAGLRKLLARAERRQRTMYGRPVTSHPARGDHRDRCRTYRVGEFVLILTEDHSRLVTFYREELPPRARRRTTPLHKGGRRRGRPRPEHLPDQGDPDEQI